MTMRGHWFAIPGVTDGARSIEEQMLGLQPALEEAPGKTIADFGTAEGMIALEFAKAGARSIYACDFNEALIDIANSEQDKLRALGNLFCPIHFHHKDLTSLIAEERACQKVWQYDIVLALAILHKMPDPFEGTKFVADAARSLAVVRLPQGSTGMIKSKHYATNRCDTREVFAERGFTMERQEDGPRGELVQYWRRK